MVNPHKIVYWVRSLPFSLFMYLKEKQYKIAMLLLCPVQGPWASSWTLLPLGAQVFHKHIFWKSNNGVLVCTWLPLSLPLYLYWNKEESLNPSVIKILTLYSDNFLLSLVWIPSMWNWKGIWKLPNYFSNSFFCNLKYLTENDKYIQNV